MDEAAVAWLREQVQARLDKAKAAQRHGPGPWRRKPDTEEPMLGRVDVFDNADAVVAMVRGSYVADHAAANDPRDVIARCEAELAILDEHYILSSAARVAEYGLKSREEYEEYSVTTSGSRGGPGDQGMGCVTCHYYAMGAVKGFGVCRTVRHVASGYQHWSGYTEHWCSDSQ